MINPELLSDTPRPHGTEVEHESVAVYSPDDSLRAVARTVQQHLPDGVDRIQTMLSSGDRLYDDIERHAETATAEFLTSAEVVGREFTLGQVLVDGLKAAVDQEEISTYILRKNATNGVFAWGYHENYLGKRSIDLIEDYLQPLATNQATRQIFAGAGDVHHGRFTVSQKMNHVVTLNEGHASSTSRRPLIDTCRDEPHATAEKWRRLHITSGDPHLFPRAAWLQLASTSMVLRMVELGVDLDDLRLKDPVAAAHDINEDLDLQAVVELENGKQYRALDIQSELVARMRIMAERYPLPEEGLLTITVLEQVIDWLENDDPRLLQWVEWRAKQRFITKLQDKTGLGLAAPHIQDAATAWTTLDPSSSIGLRAAKLAETEPDFMRGYGDLRPPVDTRAHIRGKFINHVVNNQNTSSHRGLPEYGLDWGVLALPVMKGEELNYAYLDSPLVTDHPILDNLAI